MRLIPVYIVVKGVTIYGYSLVQGERKPTNELRPNKNVIELVPPRLAKIENVCAVNEDKDISMRRCGTDRSWKNHRYTQYRMVCV